MIRLHYANRLENLIEPLAGAIAQQQRARPLERVTIVVPSRVIEQFLAHRVSEAIGIAANLDFPFLRRFLFSVIARAEPRLRVLEVEELEIVLFENLRQTLRDGTPDFHALRAYIETGGGSEAENEVRTFRLARQLAWLFREYSITRREMSQKWKRQRDQAEELLPETEKWQRRLWISTFAANGYLRDVWKANDEHDWILLADAFDTVPISKLRKVLPPIVHVFGLTYAGPAYARIFSQLGDLTDLRIYALNPCREFWEDVEHLSGIDRESWARRHSKVGSDLEQLSDPFRLDQPGDTPALRLWGRPGREYIRMLNELTECDFDAHFADRISTARPSLLCKLQEDILNRRPEKAALPSDFLPDDGSVRFLACAGIARETEIVANEIWSMIVNDTAGHDLLRFHQIGVLVPDALYEDYLPHIENAFTRLHRLPMNIVNRGSGTESPVCEAISLLLRLPLGRFSRDEMLHLLNHPVIRGADAELETDQASRWCEALGIFFGANADDLSGTYIPRDTYNWDQGLRRLALGVFMGAEREGEPRFYRAPGSIEYLPHETNQDEIAAVAAFIRTARGLLFQGDAIRSQKLTLPQWSRVLSDLILDYTQVEDPADERIRGRCIEAIEAIASPNLRSTPVSYQVAHEIVSARISEAESQMAQFTEGGIAIGPLSELRAVPFKAIFLLGMNEGQFPECDRRDPMDLRLSRRKAGDVTPAERDRYLFLETLLAAQQRICLSYIGRDATTGDPLEPASVIRELQFILSSYVSSQTLQHLTIVHPFSRYDREYFPDLRPTGFHNRHGLESHDDEARRGASMAALRADLARHCGDLPLPGRDESIYQQLRAQVRETIRPALRMLELPKGGSAQIETPAELSLPISALRRFLECPLQGAAQYALGIFEDEAEGIEDWQDEPVAQSVLDRTNLLRTVFWKIRGSREFLAGEYLKALRLSQLAGNAPVGPFAEAAKHIDRENVEDWIEQASAAGCGNLGRWLEIRMGRGAEFAQADRIVGELSLPVRCEIRAGAMQSRIVKLHGSLGFMSPTGDTSVQLVLRDKPRSRDFLGRFLSAMVLAATGELSGKQFRALVIGTGKNHSWSRSLLCPAAEQARSYLSDLISDLLFGKNHYFLPIEAVDKAIMRGDGEDPLDIVNELRDNEFAKCSSDYGPIRNARRFEPPPAESLRSILERRFGPIRGIFGAEKDE